jgi:hypothetical protein
MVISIARTNINPGHGVTTQAPQRTARPDTYRTSCPRCSTRLRIGYFEPECLGCGYVDYKYHAPTQARTSLISSGTRYVLRYMGGFPGLADTLTHIRLKRIRNRVVYSVDCPFCGSVMDQTSLSGKRREVREERYKCASGHRVSLTPGKSGGLGWK